MNIYDLIRTSEKDFREKSVPIAGSYQFSQSATLERINLYAAGQFLDGPKDEIGDRVFFDISTPAVRNAAKNIDVDTKDIQVRAVNGQDWFKSWLYRRRMKQWMRERKIAFRLNQVPEKVSGYGTVVAKKIGGKEIFKWVDLRNLACDPTAESLKDGWVSERQHPTSSQLQREGDERGWDKDAITRACRDFLTFRKENYVGKTATPDLQQGRAQYICIHEFYGHVPKRQVDDSNSDDLVLAHFVVMLPEDSDQGKNGEKALGLTLKRETIDDLSDVFRELHYRKIDGRWLGKGLYEELFPMQELKNTEINWRLVAMRISQLLIFQTKGKTVFQNVLNEMKNGHILKFDAATGGDGLVRVNTEARDNQSSQLLASEIEKNTARLANAFEVTTGEAMPSGTPWSLGNMLNQNASKLFDMIREDYGIFLTGIFEDWVLPELEKDMTAEGILEITDKDEMAYVRENIVKATAWESVKKMLMQGMNPTKEEVEIVEQFTTKQLESRQSLYLFMKKGLLDYKKKVEIQVTDERESPAMLQSLTTVLQSIVQNPAIVTLPAFNRILDMLGLSRADVVPTMQLPEPAAQPPNQPVAA